MEHRRRAADFSYLLETSCSNTTDCGSALESVTQEPNSSTQINNVTSRNNRTDSKDESSDSSSFKSTILAGHVAGSDSQRTSASSYQTARATSVAGQITSDDNSVDSCHRLEIPSMMNRAITTEFCAQPELDLTRTTAEPRSSCEMNKNIVCHSEKSSDESRDTNYNIKGDVVFPFTTENQVLQSPKHKLRPVTPRPCSIERKDNRSLLTKLDNMLDPSSAGSPKSNHKILRRLSQEFLYSPRTFTERLVTIIDESETGCAEADTSGVNLSRMTKEFRKMCKFIQDESMPEMAPSLCINSILGTSRYPNEDKFADKNKPATIAESPLESTSVECSTPQSEYVKKIYRKTPLNIFKNIYRANSRIMMSPGSPNSTRDFEYWEKQCEDCSNSPKLPAKNQSKPLRRSFSTSDISEEAKEVLIKCEEQLRSLEDLPTAEYETFDSHQGHKARKQNIDVLSEDIESDELSSSLLIEKELQRRRCFELATLMQEIEEEAKETNEEYPKALERHGIDPETAFMKTINTCLDYKNCLSGMRQSNNLKRKEASSVDSGIDIRSFGRTLYASSKKSFNDASGKSMHKQTRNYATTYKNQKSGVASLVGKKSAVVGGISATNKIEKKATSSDNLHKKFSGQVDKQSPSVSPRRPGNYLHPAAKSLAYSKTPSRGKRSPTLQIPLKTCSIKTPEKRRPREIHVTPHVPEIAINPSKSVTQQIKNTETKYLGDRLQGVSSITHRTKSPGSRCLTSSSRLSPTLRSPNTERIKKISDSESPMKSSAFAQASASPKNKFFVTPGRPAPVGRKRKTKTYFPSMDEHIYSESSQRIMKSLHAPGLFRLGYETVISPISMYIHGTDMNLIHNIHETKNEMMLTPSKDNASEEKLKYKLASPRNTPLKNCRLLSDNEESKSDDNDENIKEPKFALPKAIYNPPAQVHTVNESPNHIRGARTRGLLQSTQNRVVIRHEGKRFGKYEDNVPESYESDSPTDPDMSIHVLKSAKKTNFMGRRKMP